jgi:hypothetical protein
MLAGQTVSALGDWLGTVAVMVMVLRLSGSATAARQTGLRGMVRHLATRRRRTGALTFDTATPSHDPDQTAELPHRQAGEHRRPLRLRRADHRHRSMIHYCVGLAGQRHTTRPPSRDDL